MLHDLFKFKFMKNFTSCFTMDKAHKWETLMWGGLDYCFVLGLILMKMPMNFQKCHESEQTKFETLIWA